MSRPKTTKTLKPVDRRGVNALMKEGKTAQALTYLDNAIKVRTAMAQIDCIQHTSKRRGPVHNVCTLDSEFSSHYNRDEMISTARDLEVNFSLARGLIQTHVNNVVGRGPRIQYKTADTEWNARAEKWFNRWGRECDIRGILNWGRFIRLIERRTITDGDVGCILAPGRKLQGIESDRIANPPDVHSSDPDWVFGVKVDELLTPKAFGIYSRGNPNHCAGRRSQDFQRVVSARNFVYSYDPDRFDQVRGLSALVSAINDLQDAREGLEAVKGAIKLENILGIVLKTKPTSSSTFNPLGELTDYDITAADGSSETRKEVKIEQGVNTINIEPDEDVHAFERKTPNDTFEPWMLFEIRLAAMALDMPLEIAFHYYTRGSFSSLKGAIGQYHTAINVRRERLEDQVCTRIARWAILSGIRQWRREVAKGTPEAARRGLEPPAEPELAIAFGWTWDQLPFLEPDEQIQADTDEYKLMASTLQKITGKRGDDWEDVLTQRAREYKKAEEIAQEVDMPVQLLLPQINLPGEKPVGEEKEDGDE